MSNYEIHANAVRPEITEYGDYIVILVQYTKDGIRYQAQLLDPADLANVIPVGDVTNEHLLQWIQDVEAQMPENIVEVPDPDVE